MEDVETMKREIEEGIFGTAELGEIKRRYSAKNARTYGIALQAGIVSGVLSGFGTLGIAHYNTIKNPYVDSENVASYREMMGTLSDLREEREAFIFTDRERYVPEGMQEEHDLIFGREVTREEKLSILDTYIARVEEDIGAVRNTIDFESYKEWKGEHLTADDIGRVLIQGLGSLLLFYSGANAIGAGLIRRNNKKRDREIEALRAQNSD